VGQLDCVWCILIPCAIRGDFDSKQACCSGLVAHNQPLCAVEPDVSAGRHADAVLPVAVELQQQAEAHTSAEPVAQELCGGEGAVREALEAYLRWVVIFIDALADVRGRLWRG